MVEALARRGVLEGGFRVDGALVGVFDDALPTRAELTALGLALRQDYDPDSLRSFERAPEPNEGAAPDPGAGNTWTISWP